MIDFLFYSYKNQRAHFHHPVHHHQSYLPSLRLQLLTCVSCIQRSRLARFTPRLTRSRLNMPALTAKAVVLAKPPIKGAKLSEGLFEVVDVDLPELGDGELLIRTIYASVDPSVTPFLAACTSVPRSAPVPLHGRFAPHPWTSGLDFPPCLLLQHGPFTNT